MILQNGRIEAQPAGGTDVGIQELCPPDDPYQTGCQPPPPPPPPPDTTEPDPGPEPWYYRGISYVEPWGGGDYVDFGSFTETTKPISYLYVIGYSFIDGYLEANQFDEGYGTTFAGVGWTYHAWFYGYGSWYRQEGAHSVYDDDPAYGYPGECGCFGDSFTTSDTYLVF